MEKNDIIEAMVSRRSIRSYKPDMVPQEIIDEIIRAGTYAASARGNQSTIIIAVTNKEVRDFGQRLEIARELDEGHSYQRVAETTGVSSATIGRVKRCLDYGPGGYRMVLDRLKESAEKG